MQGGRLSPLQLGFASIMLIRRLAGRSACPALAHTSILQQKRFNMARAAASGADPTNSFILQFQLQTNTNGPLAGKTLAVKDLFDMAGHVTAFGHPLWADTHPVPSTTAPPVQALLDAGSIMVGKTHMDELAYSLNGENHHYGTPLNVAAPGRIPGGSSSGSAAAVAAQQADIGLGSDTGGSVRVPGSFCGLYGIRPTHGRITLEGGRPLAPSFDTVGWHTRDAELLQAVGQVLFASGASQVAAPGRPAAVGAEGAAAAAGSGEGSGALPDLSQPRWLVGKDAFALASPETGKAVYGALSGDRFAAVTSVLGQPTEVEVAGAAELADHGLNSLQRWFNTFRVCQGWEIWQAHRDWVTQHKPVFGPGTKERFEWIATLKEEDWKAEDANRSRVAAAVHSLLGTDGVLAIPTSPGPAIPIACPNEAVDEFRKSLISLTCIAGLSGCPQITLPIATVEGLPVGLSLIGPRNSDEQLLKLAQQLAAVLQGP